MDKEKIKELLKFNKKEIRLAGSKRLDQVAEAIAWKSGKDQEHKVCHEIWSGEDGYSIKLCKPGKEAASGYSRARFKDGTKGRNKNDMTPTIFKDGKAINRFATFVDINDEIQIVHDKDRESVILIGCLFFRNAYVLDHTESGGIWRYDPPKEVVEVISKKISTMYGIPTKAFLHYLEALAWNEDVKYHTLGYDVSKDTGRRNNLMTALNTIGVFIGEVPLSKYAGSFGRPPAGISAISKKRALEIFDYLTETE